ncbi:(E2-independent) E3 ubiquitin-conjugating enzyme FATS [Phyllopteryx taeniolatus]|uniref:(E2-independent) E3 ubiquitin-conjugating enzyme FATS n=1 Tax=Phyllopteryx taeniolatus TaxID=161469 RepID=UPI002AD443D2|nr:(E2-independent) E3 ubiquitin-conjugating enzyme FATS [Phyllopteryx taeniolatus]
MTLRRPAAHLPMGRRRSGDESYWESQSSKGESSSYVSRRAARPQSATEGRRLDGRRQHFHRTQGDADRTPASCDKEPSGQNWKPHRSSSFGGVSSSCGSMRGSSPGSRESLQSEFFAPVGRTGSLERVRISQTPKKEQSQLSYVVPVKTGWLPIQRRLTKAEDSLERRQMLSPHSAAQVKLKQPITPTFAKSRGTASLRQQDGQAERSQRRTWRTPERPSPATEQVPDKQRCAANEPQGSGIWRALRRGWNSNGLSGTRSGQRPTEIPLHPHRGPSPGRRTRAEEPPRVEEPLLSSPRATSPEYQVLDPSRGASGGPPVTPPCRPYRRHSLQPSRIQTASAPTTLVPRNKVGFSSITISSRKVGRSASLTASDRPPGRGADAMDSRKATIVKVTEQRTTVGPLPVTPRRKVAIIKVTEHKESYSPGTRCTNSYATDGEQNGTRKHPEGPTYVEAVTTDPVQNGEPAPAEEPKRKWSLGLPQENLRATPKSDHREPFAARWSSTPCLTLIQTPDPQQSPEEVLARNAAAIIANIKLQRQLSKKKAPRCNSEGESAGKCAELNSDVLKRVDPRAELAPPTPDLQTSRHTISLQEALQRSRPRFIARSQERVQEVGRRAQERRGRLRAGGPQSLAARRPTDAQRHARAANADLLKSRQGAKEFISNRPLTDVARRKEEEKKKKKKEEACLTNRQRVELFKKKLLDQILHRSSK